VKRQIVQALALPAVRSRQMPVQCWYLDAPRPSAAARIEQTVFNIFEGGVSAFAGLAQNRECYLSGLELVFMLWYRLFATPR